MADSLVVGLGEKRYVNYSDPYLRASPVAYL